MVGWRPRDPALRKAKMEEFLQRVEASQNFGQRDLPIILQYDDSVADLRPWAWPSQGGISVQPDELDQHRFTHFFKAPCCLCSYEYGPSSFSEAKIGLVQLVLQPGVAQCVGKYVAMCATQQCGYFVNLELYYGHPDLMVQAYQRRKKPIEVMDPFIFITDDTEETIKKTGLRQMQVILKGGSNKPLRGTNRLLKREDPESFLKLQGSLKDLLVRGLPADKFWDLFVQCTACNFVMPRQYFPYFHPCVARVAHCRLGLPETAPSKGFEETIDNILAEDDLDYLEDELPDTLSLFAPTSRIKSFPDRVDPYAEIVPTPEQPNKSRR